MSGTTNEATYHIHRRTLIRFILFLLALLVIADVAVIMRGHTTTLDARQTQIEEKLTLAGDFCVEAILKSDFVSVEQFLLAWTERHDEILRLKATTPNNFTLVDFQREHASNHTLSLTHQATFQNQTVLTIEVEEDLTKLYSTQWLHAYH